MEHSKGLYAPNDAISLFDTFLKTAPDVNNRMIQGIQYSGSQLNIFLNSQFNPEQFSNDKDILANKRIRADIIDYKTYQAQQSANNNQNNGGGVLSNTDSSSSATNTNAALSDAAWVVSLQIISRMDSLNDSSSK